MIVNAAEWVDGLETATEPLEAINDLMEETTAAASGMAAGMGAAADAAAASVEGAAGEIAASQEAIGASSEAMAGTVSASMGDVAEAIAAAAEASALSAEPLAAYSEALITAAGSAGDLALAQAELKASSAEVKAAVADLAGVQLTAGKDSEEYAAQLNVVADAMLREQDAAYQLRNAQIAAADATSAAAGEADAAAGQVAALGDAQVIAGKKAAAAGDETEAAGGKASKGLKLWGLAAVAGVAISVKMAGDFQQSMTRLVTSAGETQGNLATVSQGILSMSVATDTSTSQLASGMYMVESAGIHGASGLKVLQAAAEGAQAEGADLSDVTNAVTSAINAYGMKTGTAAQAQKSANSVMNEMLQIVGQGKMTMQDLASSLSAVLPIAAANKISFAEVGGALATMTSMGVSARQGSQDLAFTIRSLGNPTSVATNEMAAFGINSTDVSRRLGKLGLTGTIGYLSDAITSKMGKSGLVLVKAMNQSKSAAADAQTMLKLLPKSIQGVSKAYLDGGASYTTWYNATKSLPLTAKTMADQFAAVAGKAHGFNSLLTSGSPAAQTYSAAMAKMLGGATGLNVGLMLTGVHAKTFNDNVKAIAGSAKSTGDNINNWGLIQKNFNFQMGSAEKAVQAMAISFGQVLLPDATKAMHALAQFGQWLAKHTAACKALAIVVGVLLAGALAHGLTGALKTAAGGFKDLYGGAKSAIGFFRGAEGETSQFGKIMGGLGNAAKSAGSVVSKAWSGTMSALSSAWSGISGAASSAGSAVARAWSSSMSKIGSALSSAWSGITSALSSAWSGITSMASSAGSAIASAWSSSMTAISGAAQAAWSGIVSGLSTVGEALAGAASSVAEFAAGMASQLAEASAATVAWVGEHAAATAAFVAENAVQIASATAAFIAENLATLGIVAGIALLVAAIVYLATHWKQVWGDVKKWALDAWRFLDDDVIHPIVDGVRGLVSDVTGFFTRLGHDLVAAVEWLHDEEVSWFDRIWHDVVGAVSSLVSDVMRFFEQLPGRILGATAKFGSLLLSAGKAVVEGLIHGIEGMASDAIGTVTHLGGELLSGIGSALGIGSPSKEFAWIGQMITAGLSLGINSTRQQAVDESRLLGELVAAAALTGSVTAKEASELRKRITEALATALKGGVQDALAAGTTHQIGAAAIKLLKTIWDAVAGGDIDRSQASAMAEWVKADNARLQALAVKRNAIAKELAAAQSLASSTASAAEGTYNLSSAATTSSGGTASVAGIISTLRGDVANIRKFASNIRKLAREGLNKNYLSQLIAMGPDQGGALAQELANAGLGQLKQINAAEAGITSASNALGDAAVSAMYTAGKQSGAGFLQGLKDQEKAIEAVMAAIAASMVKKLRKDLGIASPSQVMFDHGVLIAQGLALGIASGAGQVARATAGLSAAVSLGSTRGSYAPGALSAGGSLTVNQPITVKAELNGRQIWESMQQETFHYNIRNSGAVTGTVRPGA
jgi:phage-related protein